MRKLAIMLLVVFLNLFLIEPGVLVAQDNAAQISGSETLPGIVVKGVAETGNGKYMCIINQKMYYDGDEVDGYTIEKISADHVVFMKNNKNYMLEVGVGEKNSTTPPEQKQGQKVPH